MAFSKAEQEAYIANPHFCPYCQSMEISADGIDAEEKTCQIDCESCGRSWREHLTITVTEIEETEGD